MPVSKKRKMSKKKMKSIVKKNDRRNTNLKAIRNQLYDLFCKDLLIILDERLNYLENCKFDDNVVQFAKTLNTTNIGLYEALQCFKEFTDTKVKLIVPETKDIVTAKEFFKDRYTKMVGNFLFTVLDIQFDACFNKALAYIATLNVTKDNILSLVEEAKTAQGIGAYIFTRAMVFTHCKLLLEVGFDIESFKIWFTIPTYLQLEELLYGNRYGVLEHIDILSKELNDLIATINLESSTENEVEIKQEETLIEDSEKVEFKYIDSYTKLNKLAESNGFKKLRSKGDHAIFRNESGKTVVIPQGRTIGKGLSFTIQNSIYE